mmetsp:Transcript_4133/g.6995  ORF Transcript_4133/g.6995 Transcript_4133/m.6995 type:complete len:297 (-) Transcript_4133:74-964(-)
MPNVLDKRGVLDTLPKFKVIMNPKSYRMAHPVYKLGDIEKIKYYHHEPEGLKDRLARLMIRTMRGSFDLVSRYDPNKMNEKHWLNRMIFLETVAGVPGMIGGMTRHLKSLRTLENDHGWIHHLLQEAENERMHLFIFLTMRNPGIIFRSAIALTQGIFFNVYFFSYLVSPRFCHRLVGYLEEEAVHTYSVCLEQIDNGNLPMWANMKAPTPAIDYYGLDPETASMRDVVLSVRADEAVHRSVNHHFSDVPQFYDMHNEEIHISEDGFRDTEKKPLQLDNLSQKSSQNEETSKTATQ